MASHTHGLAQRPRRVHDGGPTPPLPRRRRRKGCRSMSDRMGQPHACSEAGDGGWEGGTSASHTQKRGEACGQPGRGGDWAALTVKRPRDSQHSLSAATAGPCQRGKDTTGNTARHKALPGGSTRRDEQVTDCPVPRKETATRRNVTRGGGGGGHNKSGACALGEPKAMSRPPPPLCHCKPPDPGRDG